MSLNEDRLGATLGKLPGDGKTDDAAANDGMGEIGLPIGCVGEETGMAAETMFGWR